MSSLTLEERVAKLEARDAIRMANIPENRRLSQHSHAVRQAYDDATQLLSDTWEEGQRLYARIAEHPGEREADIAEIAELQERLMAAFDDTTRLRAEVKAAEEALHQNTDAMLAALEAV